jgi:anti-sigma regulatory factor (Ser/Thr protein kinase)
MNISGDAPFHEILKRVNCLTIPDSPHDDEHTRYAMLELINNSLRAHREKGVQEAIKTELEVRDNILNISITDRGGGFNLKKLPYNIEESVSEIDTNSSSFQTYREENQYRKFGMGLLIARRLFPLFKVSFVNEEGKTVPYSLTGVSGTRIEMGLRWNDA